MTPAYRVLTYASDAALRDSLLPATGAMAGEFVWCDDCSSAIALLDNAAVDVALLGLTDDSVGLAILDWIVRTDCGIPVLVASTAGAHDLRIQALERGAADYLIVPFTSNELLVRATTVIRRRVKLQDQVIRRHGLLFDTKIGRLGNGEKWTKLTTTERHALALLLEYGNRPVSKTHLRNALSDGHPVTDNAIEVVIHRLRAKARGWGINIRAYRGYGYVLEHV